MKIYVRHRHRRVHKHTHQVVFFPVTSLQTQTNLVMFLGDFSAHVHAYTHTSLLGSLSTHMHKHTHTRAHTQTWLCFSVTSLCCSASCRSERSLSLVLAMSSPCLWLCLRLLWLASSSRPRENRELCTPTSSRCSWASVPASLPPSGAWRRGHHT